MKAKKWYPYVLLIPTLVIIILFIYYPAVDAFKTSLYRNSVFGNRVHYVGLKNFIALFHDPEYISTLRTTFIYTIFTVSFTILASFLISLPLSENKKRIKIYRTLIFLPYAVSPAIAGTLWSFLLDPLVGQVNYVFLKVFGLQIKWLISTPYALYSIIFASVWKIMPFDVIFYIASIQSVPSELLESAKIDGANAFTRTWKIIFPLVSPITFYLIIMNLVSVMFSSFAIIDVMTKGGPGTYTNTMIYKLYLDAFTNHRTGFASAQSVVMFVLMAIVTILYFKFGQKQVHYE